MILVFKILVLGCNSFSGSHFVNLALNKNNKVYGVAREHKNQKIFLPYISNKNYKKNFFFYKKKIPRDINFINKLITEKKINYIVNFISLGMVDQSWDFPNDWYTTNVLGSVKLTEVLKNNKFIKKFLHISTPEVYGNISYPRQENFDFNPTTPYAVSRACFDWHLLNMYRQYKFPVVFSRAANLYGTHQQLYRIVPKIIISLLFKKKLIIDGKGKSKRSFVYIEDACQAYYKILILGKIGVTYHISNKKLYSIKELVKKISKILLKKPEKIVYSKKDRRGKDQVYNLNFKKIEKELHWKSSTSFRKSINFIRDWIMDNKKDIPNNSLSYIHKK